MVELKCKMCGGNLKIIDKISYATCEYCGSTMTLPNLNDDRIVNLFNRANQYRLQNEFDKAMATYENILAEDNSNAEAHWGVILAKYGIEYVEDPNTHNRVPTCHRVQYESILSDLDYKEAIKNAQDNKAKTLYEKEATQIAEIQKNILAVARNEKPYDIFICYKETDNNGQRTKDSVFAQDIYNQLVQAKYNVFFSRITLEDKLGTEYEPYIFSALNSAKVMLVIGTTKENFEAVWVKNEWSRFLELLRKDKNKTIIPCYRDMVAYDLPDELSLFQAQDMNKIGFMQDLIYGISKIIRQTPKEQNVNNSNVIVNNNQINFEELLTNARKAVEDKNWEYVEKCYSLLQKESQKNITIETTFFRTVAKVMNNNSLDNYQKRNELCNSLDVIEKYYDVTENKQEILQIISDFLFKMAFPTGKIIFNKYNSQLYNSLFYGLLVVFNNKLEQLSKIYNEEYIRSLISKNKQIIMIVNNERRKASKPAAIFAFVSFLLMAIIATGIYIYLASMKVTDDVPVSIVIVLPWLCTVVSGIILKSCNSEKKRVYSRNNVIANSTDKDEKLENKLKKIKIAKIISLIWMLFVLIAEIKIFIEDNTIFLACLMGFAIWGIVPSLIVNWIYKKEIDKLI